MLVISEGGFRGVQVFLIRGVLRCEAGKDTGVLVLYSGALLAGKCAASFNLSLKGALVLLSLEFLDSKMRELGTMRPEFSGIALFEEKPRESLLTGFSLAESLGKSFAVGLVGFVELDLVAALAFSDDLPIAGSL